MGAVRNGYPHIPGMASIVGSVPDALPPIHRGQVDEWQKGVHVYV